VISERRLVLRKHAEIKVCNVNSYIDSKSEVERMQNCVVRGQLPFVGIDKIEGILLWDAVKLRIVQEILKKKHRMEKPP
jgi:hypothetical protein